MKRLALHLLPMVFSLLLAGAAQAQLTGNLTATEVDFYSVMTNTSGQHPLNEHPTAPGDGAPLFAGGEILFPDDWSCSVCQIYRTVVASLSAPAPAQCHEDTAKITVSVRVTNLGPHGGRSYSGALRLLKDGAPADWLTTRMLASRGLTNTGIGSVVLTVTATVPAADLAAGRIFAELDLETFDSRYFRDWRADQFTATYEYGDATCWADLRIDKSVTPATAAVGDAVTYTLAVSNAGPGSGNGALVTDPGANGMNCTSLSCVGATGGAVCPASPTPAQLAAGLAVPTLPVNGSVTFQLACTLTGTP